MNNPSSKPHKTYELYRSGSDENIWPFSDSEDGFYETEQAREERLTRAFNIEMIFCCITVFIIMIVAAALYNYQL